jgi:hypothetical protein
LKSRTVAMTRSTSLRLSGGVEKYPTIIFFTKYLEYIRQTNANNNNTNKNVAAVTTWIQNEISVMFYSCNTRLELFCEPFQSETTETRPEMIQFRLINSTHYTNDLSHENGPISIFYFESDVKSRWCQSLGTRHVKWQAQLYLSRQGIKIQC